MARILVVEDDQEVQSLLQVQLGSAHQLFLFSNGREALEKAAEARPELALIDLNLPEKNGFQVLDGLRSQAALRELPCILMTGLADPAGLLETAATGLGAVDFIQKPFRLEDLQEAVAEALSGARPAPAGTQELARGPLRLDPQFRRAWVREKALGILPRRRFQLLWALASSPGPITREELLRALWNEQRADVNRLEKTVQRLREDLGRDGPRLIKTLPGGYEFKE